MHGTDHTVNITFSVLL